MTKETDLEQKLVVQVQDGEKWKVIFNGVDKDNAKQTYRAAVSEYGGHAVRVLKSNGLKEDGKTKWVIAKAPREPDVANELDNKPEVVEQSLSDNDIGEKKFNIFHDWFGTPLKAVGTVSFFLIATYFGMGGDDEKAAPELISSMTIEEYVNNCKSLRNNEFDQKCKGKLVVFDASLRKIIADNKLEIDVPVVGSKSQGFDLFLKSKINWPADWTQYELLPIRFAGILDDNGFTDHDIRGGVILSAGSITDAQAARNAIRLAQVKKEGYASLAEYNAAMAANKRCSADWRQCADQRQLFNEYGKLGPARIACKREARNYNSRPIDWPLIAFGSFYPSEKTLETGVLSLIDSQVVFENGFGGKKVMNIVCEYDLNANKIVGYSVR